MFEVERSPADLSAIPVNFQANLKPDAPPPMKLMAARGMLPVPPAQGILILYTLAQDQNEQIRGEVLKSIKDLPPQIILPVVQAQTHVGVLDWIAEVRASDSGVIEAVVTNSNTHSDTIARLVRNADASLCDIIATNQVRVLEAPQIIEQMYLNAAARVATVDALVELARRNNLSLDGIPGLKQAMASDQDIFAGGVDPDIFAELLTQESARGDAQDTDTSDGMTRAEREKAEADVNPDDERHAPLHAQIAHMSIAQKIRLASTGSREAVHLLVRDANKLVNSAAVSSPRVKPADGVKWAKNKSLPDNVIAYICGKREWTSKYECMRNLVGNPKTPLPDALGFLVHMRNADLRDLQRNRNVPGQLRRQAKSLYEKRTGGGKKK